MKLTLLSMLAKMLSKVFSWDIGGKYLASQYFRLTQFFCHPRFQKHFYALAYLPEQCEFTIKIYSGDDPYIYTTSAGDALNLDCRTSFREWELESRLIWRKLARHSSVALDIGSYTGVYALEAMSSNSEIIVKAFEPNPHMLKRLESNNALNNSRIQCFGYGLGDVVSKANLYLPYGETTSIATMIPTDECEHIEVDIVTIDSLGLGKVDLIKIDSEGFEIKIIEGGLRTLTQWKPTLLMEAITELEYSAQEKLLSGLGYVDCFPSGVGDLYGDDRNHLWVHKNKLQEWNYLL